MTSSLLEQAAADPNVLLRFAGELLAEHEKTSGCRGGGRREPRPPTMTISSIRATVPTSGPPQRSWDRGTGFLPVSHGGGLLYRCPAGYLLPYAKPSNKGLFEVKDFVAPNGHFGQQTVITPQGKALFRMLLHEN